ncbi:hypothetical protein HPB51_022153 [Rhipicephalus microplus]|uniref:Uncharacterized protein n=1 Tax=Rhipicephalus microplus TaxID=6941 RepID=A0A9J6E4S6_RHIMP|nr:hypothetical protein HPB51_022153 [Rhipicephalus microplus]
MEKMMVTQSDMLMRITKLETVLVTEQERTRAMGEKLKSAEEALAKIIQTEADDTGSGAISWPYYWDIHRSLGYLPLHDESLADESGCNQNSPAEETLIGKAWGAVQDGQLINGSRSPFPVVASESACSPQRSTSLETTEAASSCEAGLDSESSKKSQKSGRGNLLHQHFSHNCSRSNANFVSLSNDDEERELQLEEEQLKIFKDIPSIDEKLLSVLGEIVKKK